MKRPMLGLFVVAGIIILLSLFQWQGLDSILDPVDMQLRFLQNADKLELISLQPDGGARKPMPDIPPQYEGSKVLGSMEIKDKATITRMVEALRTGIRDHDGDIAACFWPRHAIRAVKGRLTMEWVICFQCRQIHIHADGDLKVRLRTLVSGTPEPIFDEVLKNAGVPLAPKRD